MTYTARAAIFDRAKKAGVTTAEALRIVDEAAKKWRAGGVPTVAEDIIVETAKAFGLTPDEVRCADRVRASGPAVVARRAAATVMYLWAAVSYPKIGAALGGRDHTTAIAIVERAKEDPAALMAAERIASALKLIPIVRRAA